MNKIFSKPFLFGIALTLVLVSCNKNPIVKELEDKDFKVVGILKNDQPASIIVDDWQCRVLIPGWPDHTWDIGLKGFSNRDGLLLCCNYKLSPSELPTHIFPSLYFRDDDISIYFSDMLKEDDSHYIPLYNPVYTVGN